MSELVGTIIEIIVTVIGAGVVLYASIKVTESKIENLYTEVSKNTAYVDQRLTEAMKFVESELSKIAGDVENVKSMVIALEKRIEKSIAATVTNLETQLNKSFNLLEVRIDNERNDLDRFKITVFDKIDKVRDDITRIDKSMLEQRADVNKFINLYITKEEAMKTYITKEVHDEKNKVLLGRIENMEDHYRDLNQRLKETETSILELLLGIKKG